VRTSESQRERERENPFKSGSVNTNEVVEWNALYVCWCYRQTKKMETDTKRERDMTQRDSRADEHIHKGDRERERKKQRNKETKRERDKETKKQREREREKHKQRERER